MNLIPGARVFDENHTTYIVLVGIGHVLVPELYADRARTAAGRNLTLGIRPIHIEQSLAIGSRGDATPK